MPDDSVRIKCPHCGKFLKAKAEYLGRKIPCPKCRLIIPVEPTEEEPPKKSKVKPKAKRGAVKTNSKKGGLLNSLRRAVLGPTGPKTFVCAFPNTGITVVRQEGLLLVDGDGGCMLVLSEMYGISVSRVKNEAIEATKALQKWFPDIFAKMKSEDDWEYADMLLADFLDSASIQKAEGRIGTERVTGPQAKYLNGGFGVPIKEIGGMTLIEASRRISIEKLREVIQEQKELENLGLGNLADIHLPNARS